MTEQENYGYTGANVKIIGVGETGKNVLQALHPKMNTAISTILIDNNLSQKDKPNVEHTIEINTSLDLHADLLGSKLSTYLEGADLVLIVAALGEDIGSKTMPVLAKLTKEWGVYSVGLITLPFTSEGSESTLIAEHTLKLCVELKLPILKYALQERFCEEYFKTDKGQLMEIANQELSQAILGLTRLIIEPGVINLDVVDIKTILYKGSIGYHAHAAFDIELLPNQELTSQIAKDVVASLNRQLKRFGFSIKKASQILINITGPDALGLREINMLTQAIHDKASSKAEMILGTVIDAKESGCRHLDLFFVK